MKFKDSDNTPGFLYEGYKFPQQYAVFGEADIYSFNKKNSHATVYVGLSSEIEKLIIK